ncbi:hypothetical protein TraAM80_01015 [Trypanosoma rangeli]|uniref:Uncharacterized protein n=1 Tax=Trypanosoma rangeli TaxID=5698 RepID=A0A3R7N1Q3_TRYRA|nr:uncharacterized protein TraAM80_01015 [Trypanosoma rangeli]RNF11398.1 hypothetical protein TraAM80_01015 [Trypanosoma rangeli]|eukprot:RNF11398.1 hypothetical protein TraAM80_01015 [Trypanosoma rangeli]
MPIKAKPIDPSRARLALLGQWNRQGTTACSLATPANGRGNDSRAISRGSSTSTSSSEGSRSGKRGRRPQDNRTTKTGSNDNGAAPAFLTSVGAPEGESDTSDSDPELYRAARERTARFLYPNGRPVVNISSSRDTAVREESGRATRNVEKIHLGVSPPRTPMNQPPCRLHTGNQQIERQSRNNDTSLLSSHEESSPPHGEPPLVIQEALRGPQGTADSATYRDFARLMDLIATDVQKERDEKQLQQQQQQQQHQKAPEGEAKHTTLLVKTKEYSQGPGQQGQSDTSKMYVVPPTTFDELQERVLLQIYAASEEDDNAKYFIATDHMAEAFTLAALEAARDDISADPTVTLGAPRAMDGNNAISRPTGTPLSIMEIIALERARRNARAALQSRQEEEEEVGGEVTLGRNSEALLCTDADVIAATAEKSLYRFLLAVRCIERAVRNRCVTDDLGRFLFAHHKPFLQACSDKGLTEDAIREFPHEAFTAYERYSRYVSKFITELLTRNVPNFDMEEFVLALFDVEIYGEEGDAREENVSMDVLSYPAWRLLLSTSSFNEFCTFMDDFIAEEYGVEKVALPDGSEAKDDSRAMPSRYDENGVVVVAGARGIRALLSRTKDNMARVTAAAGDDTLRMGIHNEGSHVGSDPFLPLPHDSSATESRASHEKQKSPLRGNYSAKEAGMRSDFALMTSLNSNSAFSVTSSAPLANSSKSPPPLPSQYTQRSKGNLGFLNSFPKVSHGRRRPDALPGRNLPPLLAVKATEAAEALFSTVPSKLNESLEDTASLPDRSGTASLTRGRSGRGNHSSGETNSYHESEPPSLTSASCGHKRKSKDSRGCSGTQTGAGAGGTTTVKKPRGKKTPSVPRR